MGEEERRNNEEMIRRRQAAEEAEARAKAEIVAVSQRLEKTSGLPPRDTLKDPQQALLKALTRPANAPPPKKKGGPCDKCDGPHHEDDCPHFKGKSRVKHNDAWDRYGKGKSASNDGGRQVILRSARIIPQPGD